MDKLYDINKIEVTIKGVPIGECGQSLLTSDVPTINLFDSKTNREISKSELAHNFNKLYRKHLRAMEVLYAYRDLLTGRRADYNTTQKGLNELIKEIEEM